MVMAVGGSLPPPAKPPPRDLTTLCSAEICPIDMMQSLTIWPKPIFSHGGKFGIIGQTSTPPAGFVSQRPPGNGHTRLEAEPRTFRRGNQFAEHRTAPHPASSPTG